MSRPNAGTKGVPRAVREQQILQVAAHAFAAEGFAATNVADIARTAGISKPLVYNYFGSKDGLYAACVDMAGELLTGEIERIARSDVSGLERGLRTLEGMFSVFQDDRHLWRLLHDPTAPTTGDVARVVSHHTARTDKLAHEGVAELLRLAGNTDEADVSAMTATWLGIVDSLMDWWVAHPQESAAAMVDRIGRLAEALLTDAQSWEPV